MVSTCANDPNATRDPADNTSTWPPQGHRRAGEVLAQSTDEMLDMDDERTDGRSPDGPDSARLTVDMLLAIYHELRHGNDQAVRRAALLAEHTKALNEHAAAMDSLKGELANHTDALLRAQLGDR